MNGSVKFKHIRLYWLAFVVSWGGFLFGYDNGIAGGLVSQPYFEASFGLVKSDGAIDESKSADVSSTVVSVMQAGAFFGALGSAPISAWLGRRWTLVGFSLVVLIGGTLTTIAGGSRGIGYIYSGRIIAGVGIGGILAVAPAYLAECSPKHVRGHINGTFHIMLNIGAVLSYFINLGVGLHFANSENVWRVPFAFQLVPAGLMLLGLLTVKESPRWLASKERTEEAIRNLAYFRREPLHSTQVQSEMTEIDVAIRTEKEARKTLGFKEVVFARSNSIRFVITVAIFTLQQWSGHNSVNHYAPQIFRSIGYTGTKNSLFATGIYGIIKTVSVAMFAFYFVENLGRKRTLFISSMGMGISLLIIGAILKIHPVGKSAQLSPPSVTMASMLYIFGFLDGLGTGPLPSIYVAEIFPTITRHYGLAVGWGALWISSFVVSKITPSLMDNLGYKIFFMFATISIAGLSILSLLIPETKGRSLEEIDALFGR